MTDVEDKLQIIRDQIDNLDGELLTLLNQRAQLAQAIAQIKDAATQTYQCYRPDREARVLHALLESNNGPLSREDVTRVFREVMSACRALQQPTRVAFLGPEGTFTQAAALRHFGAAVQTVAVGSIDAVFREVEAGANDYGVVPVENSTEGVVSYTLDLFVRSPLVICGEVELRIHHCLLGAERERNHIQRVFSHQQSFAQCRKWLDLHLPATERIGVSSNAEAARRAAAEPGSAAVAGEVAAAIYQLETLASNIEDEPGNTTRFLVIGRQVVPPTGADKTSLLLSAKNQPGALYALLEPFARHGISMTRIESRPARSGTWEYVFFVDVEGHAQEANVADALCEIGKKASLTKVLGSYPRAVP
jgi:chorismate mutase/prephenate dehydratase